MTLVPLPAFADNHIWMLQDGRHATVDDPRAAAPALDARPRTNLQLAAILVTRHPPDHTGRVSDAPAASGAERFERQRKNDF
jgi:hydroxyacylglutathione hydrolase